MKSQSSLLCTFFLGTSTLIFITVIVGNGGTEAGKVNSRNGAKHHMTLSYRRGKPVLLRPLQNVTVHLGKTAVFRCEITGSPSRIRWRRNDVSVPHTPRYRTRSYSWGGLLRIKNVRVSDYGFYSCRAKNSQGQVMSNKARLNIKGVNPLYSERCEVYTGNLCSAYLRKTIKTFIPFGKTQREIERNVLGIFRKISSYLSPRCRKYLLPSLCKNYFSPCHPRASKPTPIPICKQDCVQLQEKTCQESFGIAKAISVKLRYQLPICTRLPKANNGITPTNCQKIFISSSSTREPKKIQDNSEENQADILRTLFTIVHGVSHDSEKSQRPLMNKDDSLPVAKSTDNQKFNGKCEPYVGTICSKYIHHGQKIFISEHRTQQGFETKLNNSLALVITYTSTHCRRFALKALCYYFFPPCQKDNFTPDLICRKDCEALEARVCSKEFQYAKTVPIAGEIIPDCSFLPVKQDSCLELGLPEILPEPLECSIDIIGRRSQGKLIPKRPLAFHNTSHWCKTEFQETSSNLVPTVLRNKLNGFYQNGSKIRLDQLLNDGGDVSEYCVKFETTLQKLLSGSHMQTVTLPNMVRPDPDGLVPGLVVKFSKDRYHYIEIPFGIMPLYWPHKYLELADVQFSYRISKNYHTFVGRGHYRLCGTNFSIEIERTKYDSVRLNGHSSDPIDVNTIEQVFGVAEPSEKLLEILKRYGVFLLRLMNPSVEMYVRDTLSAKFSGISYMENLKTNAKTEVLVGKLYYNYLLTVGLIFEDAPLGQIVSSFSGIYLKYLDLFQAKDGKSKVGLSLSAHRVDLTTIPLMAYVSEPLASAFTTDIPRGLYIAAKTGTPKNCEEDQTLCRLIQVVLGNDVDFTLTGQADWQWLHFKATILNTAMKNHLPVEKVEIEMKASNRTGLVFGFRPYLAYRVDGDVFLSKKKSNKLVFTGTFFYNGRGRQLDGRMKTNAVWKKAFGYPQLTIKRMQAGFSIQLVKPYFPNKLETRADFEIGLDCKYGYESDCITGTAYIGMSDETTEQYFHGVISRFSIQDLLRVHGLQYVLPAPIGTIGFPEGLEITFAKQSHNLKSVGGPLIKPGFTMKGKIRVLGFESDCAVNLKPNEFIVDADINGNEGPIKLGGVTPLYRSRRDRKHGPKLYLETRFSPKPYVKAYIDGYTRIFGIFDEIRILMTRRHFMIRLVTSIFKTFRVRINVMANYSEDLSRTHFKAKVVFIGGLSKLTRAASKHIIAILKNELQKLQTARREANFLRSECHSETRKMCESCLRSSTCQTKLYSCKNGLNERETRAYGDRSAKHFCQRLLIENCGSEREDCKFFCKNTTARNHPCKSFIQSQRTVEDIKKSLFWLHSTKAIFTSQIFHVHGITFDTNLTPDDIGDIYVYTKLDVTLFGQRQRINGFKLKFGVFARLASDIARQAMNWYQRSQT